MRLRNANQICVLNRMAEFWKVGILLQGLAYVYKARLQNDYFNTKPLASFRLSFVD